MADLNEPKEVKFAVELDDILSDKLTKAGSRSKKKKKASKSKSSANKSQ